MQYLTDDVRITGMQEVTAPASLMQELPISAEASSLVFSTRRQIADIIHIQCLGIRKEEERMGTV